MLLKQTFVRFWGADGSVNRNVIKQFLNKLSQVKLFKKCSNFKRIWIVKMGSNERWHQMDKHLSLPSGGTNKLFAVN